MCVSFQGAYFIYNMGRESRGNCPDSRESPDSLGSQDGLVSRDGQES